MTSCQWNHWNYCSVWELTYPIQKQLGRWVDSLLAGYVSSLEDKPLKPIEGDRTVSNPLSYATFFFAANCYSISERNSHCCSGTECRMCCFIFWQLSTSLQKQELILIFSNLLEAFVYIACIQNYTVKPCQFMPPISFARHLHIAPSKGVFISLGNMKMWVQDKRQRFLYFRGLGFSEIMNANLATNGYQTKPAKCGIEIILHTSHFHGS